MLSETSAIYRSPYCALSTTNASYVISASCEIAGSTRASGCANYENEISARWKQKEKKKKSGAHGERKGPRVKGSFCPRVVYDEYNAQRALFPPTSRYRGFSRGAAESAFTPCSRSRRPLLLTRGIPRTVDHAYRLFCRRYRHCSPQHGIKIRIIVSRMP